MGDLSKKHRIRVIRSLEFYDMYYYPLNRIIKPEDFIFLEENHNFLLWKFSLKNEMLLYSIKNLRKISLLKTCNKDKIFPYKQKIRNIRNWKRICFCLQISFLRSPIITRHIKGMYK